MDLIQQFTEDAEEKSELLEWDISPRDDIPKVIVKSNDNGTLRLLQGCLVARSSYFAEFQFDDSDIVMDFTFKELKLIFELMAKNMDDQLFNRESVLSLFRIAFQYGIDDIQQRAFQFIVSDAKSTTIDLDLLIQYWLITTKYKQAESKNFSVLDDLKKIRSRIIGRFSDLLDGSDTTIFSGDPIYVRRYKSCLDALRSGMKYAYIPYAGAPHYCTTNKEKQYNTHVICFNWVWQLRLDVERYIARSLFKKTTDEDLPEIKTLFNWDDKDLIVESQDRALICRFLMSTL